MGDRRQWVGWEGSGENVLFKGYLEEATLQLGLNIVGGVNQPKKGGGGKPGHPTQRK